MLLLVIFVLVKFALSEILIKTKGINNCLLRVMKIGTWGRKVSLMLLEKIRFDSCWDHLIRNDGRTVNMSIHLIL